MYTEFVSMPILWSKLAMKVVDMTADGANSDYKVSIVASQLFNEHGADNAMVPNFQR